MRVRFKELAKVKRALSNALTWTRKAQARADRDGEWVTLPGNVLELGSSGYQIRLEQFKTREEKEMHYVAYTPELSRLAWTVHDLPSLKKFVEQQAAYRRELQL